MISIRTIRQEIDRRLRAPNVITKAESIAAIARRVAQEENVLRFDYLQTTNTTPGVIKTIEVEDGQVGLLQTEIVAVMADGSTGSTFWRLTHYRKTGGVITVTGQDDSFIDPNALTVVVTDDTNDDIKIEVTGLAATVIDWYCYTINKQHTGTALP